MSRDPFNYTWIENDDYARILAGSIPTCGKDIETLHDLGIYNMLILTRRNPEDCPDIEAAMDRCGMGWVHAPIPDTGIPSDESLERALTCLAHEYSTGEDIYVHCRGGIGRTGLILIAHYVLNRGFTVAQARDKVRVRRNYQGNASAADQGSPQREWIDALESRVRP